MAPKRCRRRSRLISRGPPRLVAPSTQRACEDRRFSRAAATSDTQWSKPLSSPSGRSPSGRSGLSCAGNSGSNSGSITATAVAARCDLPGCAESAAGYATARVRRRAGSGKRLVVVPVEVRAVVRREDDDSAGTRDILLRRGRVVQVVARRVLHEEGTVPERERNCIHG